MPPIHRIPTFLTTAGRLGAGLDGSYHSTFCKFAQSADELLYRAAQSGVFPDPDEGRDRYLSHARRWAPDAISFLAANPRDEDTETAWVPAAQGYRLVDPDAKLWPSQGESDLPLDLDDVARVLEQIFFGEINRVAEEILDLFEALDLAMAYYRPKSFESIRAKIQAGLNQGARCHSLEDVLSLISDGAGITLVLQDASAAGMNVAVEALINAITDERIFVTRIRNYSGLRIPPYLTAKQINAIKRACDRSLGPPVTILGNHDRIKKSGYTSAQFNLMTPDFLIPCDLHIRGPQVDWVARTEHYAYKLKKRITPAVAGANAELRSFADALQDLGMEPLRAYTDYLNQWYAVARAREEGQDNPDPQVPDILSSHAFFDLRALSQALARLAG